MTKLKVAMMVWNEFINDARVLKEAESLAKCDFDITVFALHTPGVTARFERTRLGVTVVRISRNPLWGLKTKIFNFFRDINLLRKQSYGLPATSMSHKPQNFSFSRALLRLWTHCRFFYRLCIHNPDVIHCHDVNTLPTAWLAAVITRASLIYDAHEISTSREGYKKFRKIVACLEKHLMPKATASITTTDIRASFFERAYKISRPIILQNRPRLTKVAKTNIIRDTLNLTEDWPIILYQGGLQQGRGLLSVIDVAEMTPNAYFVFIGGGRLENSLKSRVAKLQLQNRCFFIPTVSLDALPLYTASADIGLQPIENTCFNHFSTDSNKLFEYAMAGLPVIASDMPTIRELIGKYKFGILVKPGSCQELLEAVSSLASDNNLRSQLKNYAGKKKRKNY